MMRLSEIPSVRFDTDGVIFKYLLFKVESAGDEKEIVRCLSSFTGKPEERAIRWVEEELEEAGMGRSAKLVQVQGGGSICLNRYYETITLFGASPRYGAEPNREAVAGLVAAAFKDYRVSWYESEADSSSGTSEGRDSDR